MSHCGNEKTLCGERINWGIWLIYRIWSSPTSCLGWDMARFCFYWMQWMILCDFVEISTVGYPCFRPWWLAIKSYIGDWRIARQFAVYQGNFCALRDVSDWNTWLLEKPRLQTDLQSTFSLLFSQCRVQPALCWQWHGASLWSEPTQPICSCVGVVQ